MTRDFFPVLRDYQETGVDQLRAALLSGASSLCYVLPTGGGKTVVFAYLIAGAAAKGKRVLILAHRIEIIEQIGAALNSFGVAYGFIMPDAEPTRHNVQIASVATLVRRLDIWRDHFDLVVIDECHHAVAGSWAKIIASQPRAKFLGVTATPERLDGRGLGDVFEQMVEGPTIGELIEAGHLAPFTVFAPDASPDLSGVKTRLGDYELEGLRDAMGGVVVESAVDEYLRLCPNTPSICFCIDIGHSEQVANRFRAHGVRAAHLDGDTPGDERKRLIRALGDGGLDVLCNCDLIGEGLDIPSIGAAILLRPTQSLALFLQQIGRALRPAPGKDRALILDFSGNTIRHGLPDEPREWSLESKARRERSKTPAMAKRCKECGAMNAVAARVCVTCGADLVTSKERAEVAMRLREAESAALVQEIRAMPYRDRLRWADGDEQKLRTVARACNYRRGWIYHVLVERRERAA